MPDTALVSIIIPAWNLWDMTEACLLSLAEHTEDLDVEVLVVDNHSTDATATQLETVGKALFGPAFTSLRMEENVGFARGCNAGAAAAQGELLFFLNNDTTVTTGWLPPLRAAMSDPRLGAVGPLLLYPDDTVQHCGIYLTPFNAVGHLYEHAPASFAAARKPHPLQVITGAALMLRKADFDACGRFHEGYRNGFEDMDLCCALRARGKKLRVAAQSVIRHHTSQTPGRFDSDAANSALFARRCGAGMCPDEHILAALDGYELRIGPDLDTWMALPDSRQEALNTALAETDFDPQACRSLLLQEPLWRDGWLWLAWHAEESGDPQAALALLSSCARLLPEDDVYAPLLRLSQQLGVNGMEHVQDALRQRQAPRPPARCRPSVLQARRQAIDRGDTRLAALLDNWLARHAAGREAPR